MYHYECNQYLGLKSRPKMVVLATAQGTRKWNLPIRSKNKDEKRVLIVTRRTSRKWFKNKSLTMIANANAAAAPYTRRDKSIK